MAELLTVHPSPSPKRRSNQPSHSSEDRALKMPTMYPPPPPPGPASFLEGETLYISSSQSAGLGAAAGPGGLLEMQIFLGPTPGLLNQNSLLGPSDLCFN